MFTKAFLFVRFKHRRGIIARRQPFLRRLIAATLSPTSLEVNQRACPAAAHGGRPRAGRAASEPAVPSTEKEAHATPASRERVVKFSAAVKPQAVSPHSGLHPYQGEQLLFRETFFLKKII